MSGIRTAFAAAAAMAFCAGATGAGAANLLVNGDFEGGASGFSSDYNYSPGDLGPAGAYDVINDPRHDHPLFAVMGDHTSGAGLMMVINGASTPDVNVWAEAGIPVTPHTNYTFSGWVASVYYSNTAQLDLDINGSQVGPTVLAPGVEGVWQQFSVTWNSGSATKADLAVVNQNISPDGNDFALDDISLASAGTAPEPSSWTLLLAGMGALGGALRRRSPAAS
jgi:hypothetical protein